jgi:hypothetical protein
MNSGDTRQDEKKRLHQGSRPITLQNEPETADVRVVTTSANRTKQETLVLMLCNGAPE